MKFYVNGIRRGLGKFIYDRLDTVETLEECDIFINCKHQGFDQVDLLYKACELNKRVINISSGIGDSINQSGIYAVQKVALDKANEQLFYQGHNVTSIRLGWVDTERVAEGKENKMSCRSVLDNIEWILLHPHRIKEITIIPNQEPIIKKLPKQYDINKILLELKSLPKLYMSFNTEKNVYEDVEGGRIDQIALQTIEGMSDSSYGTGRLNSLKHNEEDFVIPLFDIPYINSIIKELGMYRTRVMRLSPSVCYSYHQDPTMRIHIPLITNDNCFMIIDNEIIRYPADGHCYRINTTKFHTAVNAGDEDRFHIVGCINV